MNRMKNFTAGFIRENPVFSLYLGLCSTLAISTTLNNAIGMGVAVIVVLILSNVMISAIRNITPNEIRIPVYIVIIAALVKVIQMLIKAYTPSLDTALGVFIPLIVVNCIILGRAEAFASKNSILDSALDGLGMGLGYTLAVTAIAIIRQILSTGILSFANPFNIEQMIFSIKIIPSDYIIPVFSQPLGAFFTFALIAGGLAAYKNSLAAKEKAAQKQVKEAK
ncbi:MAG: electron transport complex subunit E [Erysipelotrichaceae bacterium]